MKAPSLQDRALDLVLPPVVDSPRAKLTYLYPASVGETTVDELQAALRESLLCL